jgi:hypothetical protein
MNHDDNKACESAHPPFTTVQLEEILPHIRLASAALLKCWDELLATEKILDIEVSIDELGTLATGLNSARDAADLEVHQIAFWLANVVGGEGI